MTPPDLDNRISGKINAISGNREPITGTLEEALKAVPRHLFVPSVGLALADDGPVLIDWGGDPDAWWAAVDGTAAIVTQLEEGATALRATEGRYNCSSSALGTVVRLLGPLNPQPGHRVLEGGTGTGWTAALLSHLVGEDGSVTSIEVDEGLGEQAAKSLAAVGAQPHLIVGDGAAGCPDRAPYDRVHVTCGIHTVPYAWIQQAAPGAVVVAPLLTFFRPGCQARPGSVVEMAVERWDVSHRFRAGG
ncbi:methyltransferase domain-containing protein [Nonomuraea sp. NPDC049129]|uniref:methyltransferase domain-containing protein n=1 Tax=Nonomuraea sp. NPDC049129 TaxID=3155272 RepID=UPI0033EEC4E5